MVQDGLGQECVVQELCGSGRFGSVVCGSGRFGSGVCGSGSCGADLYGSEVCGSEDCGTGVCGSEGCGSTVCVFRLVFFRSGDTREVINAVDCDVDECDT